MKKLLVLAVIATLLASCQETSYVYCPAYAQNNQADITSNQ